MKSRLALRIKYEDEAKLDLLGIKNHYLAIGGKVLARRMVGLIRSDTNALLNYTALAYELVPNMRRLVVANGAYLVFHRVKESVVEVLHIRRAERAPATEKDVG
jgi:plasmid stabilization system protein ParE